ncbi:MAG: peptidoglycan bridge formation glycyltransferase FemA/FemB family protein [bacterium]|nr:peptidoglycan bridge formation glycyltransferase FemA/FemB family protein [bacterium]
MVRVLTEDDRGSYDSAVSHVMQSWTWGEFREQTRIHVVRIGEFDKHQQFTSAMQMTLHPIPKTPWTIGYIPKGPMPSLEMVGLLRDVGEQHRCIFIQIEPNIEKNSESTSTLLTENLRPAARPLFTKFNFLLDLTPSEETILSAMHHKTRYNIRLAERKGVAITIASDKTAFDRHLMLYLETTRRQQYFGHDAHYHKTLYQTLAESNSAKAESDSVKPFFVQAWTPDKKTLLSSWMLLHFRETLYYPYGGSSDEHRELMASNLVAWEAIKLGKKLGCTTLDFWGALSPDADPTDPWYGFHRFKQGYGARHVEYVGSFDLVLNLLLYKSFVIVNKLRWTLLKMRRGL